MFKFGKLIALAIASFYLSGCASIMTAEQAAPAVNTPNELESVVVFRILCHFVKLSKKEMTYDQNQFRHGCRFKAVA